MPNRCRLIPIILRIGRRGWPLTALAGPLSNLLMAILSVGLYRVLIIFVSDGWTLTLLRMGLVELFASINISLAMFNLLPIPACSTASGLSAMSCRTNGCLWSTATSR